MNYNDECKKHGQRIVTTDGECVECFDALTITPLHRGYLIERHSDGAAFIQRRDTNVATDAPISFAEEIIIALCDMITNR